MCAVSVGKLEHSKALCIQNANMEPMRSCLTIVSLLLAALIIMQFWKCRISISFPKIWIACIENHIFVNSELATVAFTNASCLLKNRRVLSLCYRFNVRLFLAVDFTLNGKRFSNELHNFINSLRKNEL